MLRWSFTKNGMSLKAIADELLLNPIKVRKLLITAGVYKSEKAEKVRETFLKNTERHRIIKRHSSLQL